MTLIGNRPAKIRLAILKLDGPGRLSLLFLLFVLVIAIAAPWLTPYSFSEQNISDRLQTPSWRHLLGTDSLGRDLLSRILYGSRVSLGVGTFTSLGALVIGGMYGSLAGWFRGRGQAVMMMWVDVLMSIPSLVLLILLNTVFDGFKFFSDPEFRAVSSIAFSLSLIGWGPIARLVHIQVKQVSALSYIEAARAIGGRPSRLIFHHIWPNIMGPVMVLLTHQIRSLILAESFLSFIGLGLQPPYSSWGVLINEGWYSWQVYPHLMLFPALMIYLTLLAFNLLGDSLRDAMAPNDGG